MANRSKHLDRFLIQGFRRVISTISFTLAHTRVFVPLLILAMAVSLLMLALPLSGCSTAAAARPSRLTIDFTDTVSAEEYQSDHTREPEAERALRIAVSPTLSQKSTIEAYRLLAAHIGSKLGRETILLERKSYAEINVLLANGGADVAFLASGAYISYTGLEDIVPLVTQIRFGLPYYHSYIIVAKDSGLTKLEDLRDRTFAFTDPLSFSGYYVPTYMLRQIGESPDTFFKSTIFTYGHEKALQAVANKMVDAAAIGSHVYADSLAKKDGYAERVQIIALSEKSGNGPVVVRKGLGDAEIQSLKEIFLTMHQDPDLKDALSILLVDAYVETSQELYAFQRQIIREFGTRE